MVPVLFGASVTQVSLLIDTLFASFLPTGSISWLYYSDRLIQFPLGVFGVAISTVVLPHLSENHAKTDLQGYKNSLDWALRLIVLIGIPSAVGIATLSGPMLTTLFGYGKFNAFDVLMAQKSLISFAFGLVFFMLLKVVVSAFYARQDMKTPVKAALWAMGLNIVANLILIKPLAHAGVALATSISSAFDVIFLLIVLHRSNIWRLSRAWYRTLLATGISATLMGLILHYGTANISHWQQWHAGTRIWHLALWVIAAKFIYMICTYMCRIRKIDWVGA